MTPYANGKRRVARGSVHTEGHELVAPELAKWPLCLLLIIAWKDVPRCRLSRGWTDLTIFLRTRPEIRRSRKGCWLPGERASTLRVSVSLLSPYTAASNKDCPRARWRLR